MSEKYKAFKSDSGYWGVEDSKGGILYEADCEFSEAQARYIADLHTNNNSLEWDSIAKAVELMDAPAPEPEPAPTGADAGVVSLVVTYLDMMNADPHVDLRVRIGSLVGRASKAYSDTLADKEWEAAKRREAEAELAAVRAQVTALTTALEQISYLAPDKEPAVLLGTSPVVREAYKLGYEMAQWEDAKIARKSQQATAVGARGEGVSHE